MNTYQIVISRHIFMVSEQIYRENVDDRIQICRKEDILWFLLRWAELNLSYDLGFINELRMYPWVTGNGKLLPWRTRLNIALDAAQGRRHFCELPLVSYLSCKKIQLHPCLFDVCCGCLSGLEYLHTGCTPCIIHRDVRPPNILLTSRMVAKVAHFGFAKCTSKQDPTLKVYSFDVKGTAGYLDPE